MFLFGELLQSQCVRKKYCNFTNRAVTSPLSLFVVAFATLSLPEGMQKAAPLVPALKSNWLMMHVSIMMLSYSTLITGSLLSILFLVLTLGKECYRCKEVHW